MNKRSITRKFRKVLYPFRCLPFYISLLTHVEAMHKVNLCCPRAIRGGARRRAGRYRLQSPGSGIGRPRTAHPRIGKRVSAKVRGWMTTIVPGASRVNLAWMLTAGVATSLAENATRQLAWRYTDLGTAETGRAGGRVVWYDGSHWCSISLRHERS